MNKSSRDEYSEMLKLFNQLTVDEAELVLIFIRNLRKNSDQNANKQKED